MILEHSYTVNDDDLITEKDISRSRGKKGMNILIYDLILLIKHKEWFLKIIKTIIAFSSKQILFNNAHSNKYIRVGSEFGVYVDSGSLGSDLLLQSKNLDSWGKIEHNS